MKKFSSKLLACLTSGLLLCATLPISFAANAATTLTSDGGVLSGDSYVLESDISLTKLITVSSGSDVTIDLNGYTLTLSGYVADVNGGTLTIEDSSTAATGTVNGRIHVENGGSFILNGGTITGNSASAVMVEGSSSLKSSFTMNGGAITGNTAKPSGAGVYLYYGSFTMNGGTISDNTVTSTSMSYGGGAGVYARYSDITMTGGSITNNTYLKGSYSSPSGGGAGVYLYSGSTMTMSGGSITDNDSYENGAGIQVQNSGSTLLSAITISGDAVVSGNTNTTSDTDSNVYLTRYEYITLGELTTGADIGVTLASNRSEGSTNEDLKIISDDTTDANKALASSYLKSDTTGYYVVVDASGAVVLSTEPPAVVKVSEPGIAKSADVTTAAAGDAVNYTMVSTVPETLVDYIDYSASVASPAVNGTNAVPASVAGTASAYALTFVDSMDANLTLDESTIAVEVGDTTLAASYYTVTTGTNSFTVAIDLGALYNAGIIDEDDMGLTDITVTYAATVGATAGALANSAYVTYPEGSSATATATVETYGVSVFKYDQSTNGALADATFELKDENGTVIATITSDSTGYATYYGLADGTYTLTETKAPDGYVKSSESVEFTVSTDATNYVVQVNFANMQVPSTGGAGTMTYTVVGLGVLLAAAALFLLSRKANKASR